MKTAIYIEDGIVQLVITPESDFEKNALSTFEKQKLNAEIMAGSFYDCRGGWIRQKEVFPQGYGSKDNNDKSLIIRVEEEGIPCGK